MGLLRHWRASVNFDFTSLPIPTGCFSNRTFTFWRFLIHIPLAQHQMIVRYSVNNGQRLEFYVPGRNQNMRWAAHSVRGSSAPQTW